MASSLNADNGVVSGSAGLKSTADSSGVLALQTNGTTAVTVDTSQNVGIGITSGGGSKLAVAVSPSGNYISGSAIELVAKNSNGSTRPVIVQSVMSSNDNGSELVFKTSDIGNTTGTERARINANGAWSFGSSGTATGTSGQVLTSGGSGAAPSWSTLTVSGSGGATASGNVTLTSASAGAQAVSTTSYGQTVFLPDATTMTKAACVFNISNTGGFPLRIKNNANATLGFIYPGQSSTLGLADNSTAAGSWVMSNKELIAVSALLNVNSLTSVNTTVLRRVAIDTSRTLILFGATNGVGYLYGVVYNDATNTAGTPVAIRTTGSFMAGLLIGTDKVLVASGQNASTAFEAVVLSLSGTTISVGTAATATLSGNMTSITSIVAVGSSYVVNYNVTTTAIQIRALTVSGTTVTIGSSTSVATGSSGYTSTFAASTSVYLNFSFNAGTLAITPYTISGTTITLGSATSLGVSATYPGYKVTTISNGTRWICVYSNGAETAVSASIVSLSGANATTTTASAYTTINDIALVDLYSYGSKCLVTMGTSGVVNIITDTAGTASAGTVMTGLNGSAYPTIVSADSTYAMVVTSSSGGQYVQQVQINISGTSPTLTAQTWFGSGANTGIKAFGPCNTNGTQRACWTKGSINCSVGTIISTGVQNQKTSVVTGYGGYVFYPAFTQPGLLDGGSQMVMGYDNEIWYGGNAGISRFEGPT